MDLWVEKYRPKTVSEVILPNRMRTFFDKIVEEDNIPLLLLGGAPGTGKTSLAVSLCETLGHEYLILNASDDGNIDTLRTVVKSYAMSSSMNGKYKVIILDEAEQMSAKAQDAFKKYPEEFHLNCRFILISNAPSLMTDAIKSRFEFIDFSYSKSEIKEMAKPFWMRLNSILSEQGITIEDRDSLMRFVAEHLPDMRHILKSLQAISMQNGNRIPKEIKIASLKLNLDDFMTLMKDKTITYDEKKRPILTWYKNLCGFVEKTSPDVIYQFVSDNAVAILEGVPETKSGENLFKLYMMAAHYDRSHSECMIKQTNTIAFLMNVRSFFI